MGNSNSTYDSQTFSLTENNLMNDLKSTLNADTETFVPNHQLGGVNKWKDGDAFVTPSGLYGIVLMKRTEPYISKKNLYKVKITTTSGVVEETMWPETDMKQTAEEIKRELEEKHRKTEVELKRKQELAEIRAAEFKKKEEERRRIEQINSEEKRRHTIEQARIKNLAEQQKKKQLLEQQQRKIHDIEIAQKLSEEKKHIELKEYRVKQLEKNRREEARIINEIELIEKRIQSIKSSDKPKPVKLAETHKEEENVAGLKTKLDIVNTQIANLEK